MLLVVPGEAHQNLAWHEVVLVAMVNGEDRRRAEAASGCRTV